MKKLIFGLSLLLVAVASLLIISNHPSEVVEDSNEAYVTECAKKEPIEVRDGDPDEGVTIN